MCFYVVTKIVMRFKCQFFIHVFNFTAAEDTNLVLPSFLSLDCLYLLITKIKCMDGEIQTLIFHNV